MSKYQGFRKKFDVLIEFGVGQTVELSRLKVRNAEELLQSYDDIFAF